MTRRNLKWLPKVALTLALAIGVSAFGATKGDGKPPTVNRQQQAGHVSGTPQHLNRVKQGKPTSTFFGPKSGEMLTKKTWETGKPVPGRPQMKERAYPISTGVGPSGGFQKSVRVSMNKRGEIHGHPSGKETK